MEPEIFKRIENAPKPDFGNVISESFELYKKVFSQGLIHALLSMVVVIPFMLLVYIPILPMYADMISNMGNPYYQPDISEFMGFPMMILWVFVILIGAIIVQFVTMSIYGHFFREMKRIDFGTSEDIGGYFTILKEHFGKLVLLSLATVGIVLLAELLCFVPVLYVIVPIHWIFPIFVFNQNLSASEIIKAAFKLGNKNWLIFAGLGIVVSIMASLGAILCYVGIIATYFFTYVATYVAYRDTIGFDDVDAISEIGTNTSDL